MRRPKPQAGVHNAAGAINHTAAVEISSTKSTFQWIHRLPWNIVFIHVIICVDVDCFLWSYLMKCKFTILHWPAAVTWTKALKCYRVTNWFKRWTLSLTNQFSNLHESYKITKFYNQCWEVLMLLVWWCDDCNWACSEFFHESNYQELLYLPSLSLSRLRVYTNSVW